MLAELKADIARKQAHYVLVDKFFNKFVKVGLQFGTLAVAEYRLGRWSYGQPAGWRRTVAVALYRLIRLPLVWVSRIDICPHTPIGKGLVIHNFSTIFVDALRIGENLTLNQGVTVGPDWTRTGRPQLGDNVFIGSGAKILGGVTVGDNVVVAANALVIRSVPANCIVAGVPAVVVSRDAGKDYLDHVPARRGVQP